MTIPNSVKVIHVRLPGEAREDLADADPRKGITHNFNRSALPPGHKHLALITCDGIDYCAVAVIDKEGVTSKYQSRVRCSFIQEISPIPFQPIQDLIPVRLKPRVVNDMGQVIAELTRPGGRALLKAAISLSHPLADAIGGVLQHIAGSPSFKIPEKSPWVLVKQELDAVDTALALVDMPPAGLDSTLLDPDHPAPVLSLMSPHALEDGQIDMDARAFGGLTPFREDVRGAKEFRDPVANSRVTVINVNRRDLEHTLGVDLIIYYSRFRSYLLIQYKRLTSKSKGRTSTPSSRTAEPARFYPSQDRNFGIAVKKMAQARNALGVQVSQVATDFRLCDDPFYFKFCPADAIDPDSRGMVKGLYILAVDVETFLASEESKGSGGGHSLGFDNLGRRFPNSLFVDLARTGWIGSRQVGSKGIEHYIKSSLDSGHSVVLAHVEVRPSGEMGRDADEDLRQEPGEPMDPFLF